MFSFTYKQSLVVAYLGEIFFGIQSEGSLAVIWVGLIGLILLRDKSK